jgi:hypothetical protein
MVVNEIMKLQPFRDYQIPVCDDHQKCYIHPNLNEQNMEILGVIGPWQIMILLVFSFLFLIPWIVALVDILSNEFTGNNKLIWVLVVALTGILGAILYLIIGLRQKLPKNNHP